MSEDEFSEETIIENQQVLDAIRKSLYGENGVDIVASYMKDTPNQRIDDYQCIKMLRVVMAQLYDVTERLKVLEGRLK